MQNYCVEDIKQLISNNNYSIENLKKLFFNDNHNFDSEELKDILTFFINNTQEQEFFILNLLQSKKINITIKDYHLERGLFINFYGFEFLIFLKNNELKIKIITEEFSISNMNDFEQSFFKLRSMINEHSEHFIYLLDNKLSEFWIKNLNSRIQFFKLEEKKLFIEQSVSSHLTKDLIDYNLPKYIYSISFNDDGEISIQSFNIRLGLSLLSRKKIEYLEENSLVNYFPYDINNDEVDSLFESSIKKTLLNSTDDCYSKELSDIINSFEKYKSVKEGFKIYINNKPYDSLEEIKDLKFLIQDNKLLSQEEAIFFDEKNINEIYEYLQIKKEIKDF